RTVRRIGIRAELYASHIFEPDYRTIAVRLDDDILVVWDLVEFTLVSQHIFVHFLAALTQPAGSGLETLILDRIGHFDGRKVIGHKPVRLKPDAHGIILGTKRLGIGHTGDTLDPGDQVDLCIVLQKGLVIAAVRRIKPDEHDDTVLLFLGGDTRLNDFR